MVRYRENLTKLFDTVLSGPGTTSSELRHAVDSRAAALSGGKDTNAAVPDELSGWIEKVARHAYRTTDEDMEALKVAGYSDDELFEITVAAALGASRARLERALEALGETEGTVQ